MYPLCLVRSDLQLLGERLVDGGLALLVEVLVLLQREHAHLGGLRGHDQLLQLVHVERDLDKQKQLKIVLVR